MESFFTEPPAHTQNITSVSEYRHHRFPTHLPTTGLPSSPFPCTTSYTPFIINFPAGFSGVVDASLILKSISRSGPVGRLGLQEAVTAHASKTEREILIGQYLSGMYRKLQDGMREMMP